MKVWVGYQCSYNYCDEFCSAVKIFDDEVKALIWQDDFKETDFEYRKYEEMKVE